MAVSRSLGISLPDEGNVRVRFDHSTITDTSAEKRQDIAEVPSGLMHAWEYRRKCAARTDPPLAGSPGSSVASRAASGAVWRTLGRNRGCGALQATQESLGGS